MGDRVRSLGTVRFLPPFCSFLLCFAAALRTWCRASCGVACAAPIVLRWWCCCAFCSCATVLVCYCAGVCRVLCCCVAVLLCCCVAVLLCCCVAAVVCLHPHHDKCCLRRFLKIFKIRFFFILSPGAPLNQNIGGY